MPSGLSMLAVNSPVMVRVGNRHDREYSSRIEDLSADALVVAAPPGANSALLASGTREIELSWLSPRGRYEQRCRLELDTSASASGPTRNWRLKPMRRAILIQRRRYIRVRANVDVTVEVCGETLAGSTVDVSEGGFRIRVPRRAIPELDHTVVRAVIGGSTIALPGYLVRASDVEPDQTEAVIAFEADGGAAEAVRRFVLHLQLRARASRDS